MSVLSNYVRGFNEDRFWKYYEKSKRGNKISRVFYTALYMRMASKQGGYVGKETIFHGKPHFPHGLHGVHISRMAEVGMGVTIFQGVTIGQAKGGAPTIGNNVMCGANATIIGPIIVGDHANIGGAVVAENIPCNATVVSPKARIIIPD